VDPGDSIRLPRRTAVCYAGRWRQGPTAMIILRLRCGDSLWPSKQEGKRCAIPPSTTFLPAESEGHRNHANRARPQTARCALL
jgi:hypothetical protein